MAHDLPSLITVLQQDRVHEKALVESLLEKVTSSKDLLEKLTMMQHRLRGNNKESIQELQSEIRDAAQVAEDIIESHAVDQMLSKPKATTSAISPPDLSMTKVMEKFDAAIDKLTKIIKLHSQYEGETTMAVISNPCLSVAADPKANTPEMVGFEEDALQLKHRLTSKRGAREIIPIIGMGGIGKTTLARNLYDDPLVVSHFDVRAWVTVSQDYNERAILFGLLGITSQNNYDNRNCGELGDTLYRRLYGRRYLVVLDDLWSEKAWDEIQRYFPNENHRSRILMTSRELHVAKHADSACEEHQMRLLSNAQGWHLLCEKVFEKDEHCPPFLEEIGRKIASNCRGLPLAISVVGGLLSVDKHSEGLWDKVARDVRSITDNHVSEILCLSYDNLPLHLKSCFLYMSAFPEDYEARRWSLVKLLVAEGFILRSNEKNKKSLEDVAEEYLKALVDRNLLSVTRTNPYGRAECFSMHDLLRDLCVRKADEEKFLRSFKSENFHNFRRVSVVHQFTEGAPVLSSDLSYSRTLLFHSPNSDLANISAVLSTLRLVRVLDVSDIPLKCFPKEILKLANLRFLSIHFGGNLPSALWRRLRNLQTLWLFFRRPQVVKLPSEAWEISSLRHIMMIGADIYIDLDVPHVHENLQTIYPVCLLHLSASDLINNIPNIRYLGINGHKYTAEDRNIDLSHLHKLEWLALNDVGADVLNLLKLPYCLKELSLVMCTLPIGLVHGVGDLPNLQALKMESCVFQSEEHREEEQEQELEQEEQEQEEEEEEEEQEEDDEIVEEEEEEEDNFEEDDDNEEQEWEVNEGVEFCSLQFLELHNLRIKRWEADYSHFPRLAHLKIEDCEKLEEIPACIEEMSTLELIEVDKDNPCLVKWAKEVRKTQRHEYGNEILKIGFN